MLPLDDRVKNINILYIFFTKILSRQANNQHYDLNFNEKGNDYKEKIDIDRQKGIVIYDVPNHAGIGGAQFLKDFKMVSLRLIFLFTVASVHAMGISTRGKTRIRGIVKR